MIMDCETEKKLFGEGRGGGIRDVLKVLKKLKRLLETAE
jgi:hypothetical protein